MDKPRSITTLDLEEGQLEDLEDELGVPIARWGQEGSVLRTYRRILEVGNDVPPGTYRKLSGKDMIDLVSIAGDDGDDDPNP